MESFEDFLAPFVEIIGLIFESILDAISYIWEYITGVHKIITGIIATSMLDFIKGIVILSIDAVKISDKNK